MRRFQFYNPNPNYSRVGDCAVRALCKALDRPWEEVYSDIVVQGYAMSDMPSSNAVWGQVLEDNGFKRMFLECPNCYTLNEFAEDYPDGTYVCALSQHVVTVEDGTYFDTWDSGDEHLQYVWKKES